MFDLLTSAQWAQWPIAPVERQERPRTKKADWGSGAEVGGALHEVVVRRHGEILSDLLESGASPAAKDVNIAASLST